MVLTVTLIPSSIQASDSAKQSQTASPRTLLVIGDSLSAGYGIAIEKGWVKLLEQRLQHQVKTEVGVGGEIEVVNASISGDTTGNARKRFKPLLSQHQPDIVIIGLGGNDGLRGFPLALIKRNLAELITESQSQGAQVVLLGIRIPPNYGFRYSEGFFSLYQQLATEHNTALVPFFMQDVGDNPAMMQADGIHPNEAAQPVLLENIWPVIQQFQSSS